MTWCCWTFYTLPADASKIISYCCLILNIPPIRKCFAEAFSCQLGRHFCLLITSVFLFLSKRFLKFQLGFWLFKIKITFPCLPYSQCIVTWLGVCQWHMSRSVHALSERCQEKEACSPSLSVFSWLGYRSDGCLWSSLLGPWSEHGNRSHPQQRNELKEAWVPAPWSIASSLDCPGRLIHYGKMSLFV